MKKIDDKQPVNCACGFVCRFGNLSSHQKNCKETGFSFSGEHGSSFLKSKEWDRHFVEKKKKKGLHKT